MMGKQVVLADPRRLIVDRDSHEVVYNPRAHEASMLADMQASMLNRPEWPPTAA